MENKNRPVQKYKAGAITATIWKNEFNSGSGENTHYFSVSLDRAYTDKNGEWKRTNSMRATDLPKATLVLNKAYEYLTLEGASEHSQNSSVTETKAKQEDVPAKVEEMDIIM